MDILIVGGGVAGFTAAAACRNAWPDRAVTLIDAENEVGYYRTLLPQFMVGTLPETKLFFPPGDPDPLFTVRTGVRVKSLDRAGQLLQLATGESLGYDRLILAHGGEAYLPGILAGPPARGIFPVRDLTTARAAKAWLVDHRKVIVFGGSLVAVKTAVHLRQAGFEVSLVVRRGHILLRALSSESAALVEDHLRRQGVRIVVNAPLEDIRITQGTIAAIKAGGEWVEGNSLIVAAGVVPDTAFVEGTGLLTDGQLVVSEAMQTSDRRVFAAGDVAAIGERRLSPNTWPQAVSQARTAAANLYRTAPIPLRDPAGINAMELDGLAMVILGPPVAGAETISFGNAAAGIRRELFLRGGKPVGGALIGDISAAGTLHALLSSGRTMTAAELRLLAARSRTVIPFPERAGRRTAYILKG